MRWERVCVTFSLAEFLSRCLSLHYVRITFSNSLLLCFFGGWGIQGSFIPLTQNLYILLKLQLFSITRGVPLLENHIPSYSVPLRVGLLHLLHPSSCHGRDGGVERVRGHVVHKLLADPRGHGVVVVRGRPDTVGHPVSPLDKIDQCQTIQVIFKNMYFYSHFTL